MNNKIEGDLKYVLHSLCYIGVIDKINFNDYDDFISKCLLDSVIFMLVQIGENVIRLTSDFKINHSNIDFINIKGLRNIVVHDYNGLNYDEIYSVIEDDLPDLKEKYESIVINEFNLSKDFIDDYINYYLEKRVFKDIM